MQAALGDAGTEVSSLPVQTAAALEDAGAEMSPAPVQAAAAVQEEMSLISFCAGSSVRFELACAARRLGVLFQEM